MTGFSWVWFVWFGVVWLVLVVSFGGLVWWFSLVVWFGGLVWCFVLVVWFGGLGWLDLEFSLIKSNGNSLG